MRIAICGPKVHLRIGTQQSPINSSLPSRTDLIYNFFSEILFAEMPPMVPNKFGPCYEIKQRLNDAM